MYPIIFRITTTNISARRLAAVPRIYPTFNFFSYFLTFMSRCRRIKILHLYPFFLLNSTLISISLIVKSNFT